MTPALTSMLPQLGVGVAAVVVIYLTVSKALDSLNVRDSAFKSYVEDNNHKSVEVMTECRDAIRNASDNIKSSVDLQKQVIEHLIRDHNG